MLDNHASDCILDVDPSTAQSAHNEENRRNAVRSAIHLESVHQLPYRPNQQVEFLNLQVETEALLHQIYLQVRQRQRNELSSQWQLSASSCS